MKSLLLAILVPLAIFADNFDRFKITRNGIETHYAWVEIPEGLLSSVIPRPALVYLHGEDEEGNISRYRTELVDIEIPVTLYDEEDQPYTGTKIIQRKQRVKQDITKVTLEDFTLSIAPSKNPGKVIIAVGACLGDQYRVKPVNAADVGVWLWYLLPHNFTEQDLLTKQEMQALLPIIVQ